MADVDLGSDSHGKKGPGVKKAKSCPQGWI